MNELEKEAALLSFLLERNNRIALEFQEWAANAVQTISWDEAIEATGLSENDVRVLSEQFAYRGWTNADYPLGSADTGFIACLTGAGLDEAKARPQRVRIENEVRVAITRIGDIGLDEETEAKLAALVRELDEAPDRKSKATTLRKMFGFGADSVTTIDGIVRFVSYLAFLGSQVR